MDFEVCETLQGVDVDAIVVPIPEGMENADALDARFASTAKTLLTSGDLPLKPLETLIIPGTPKIVFIGVARALDAEAWRRVAATAVRRVKKVRRLAFVGGDVRVLTEGALIGSLSVETYKTGNNKQSVERVLFGGGNQQAISDGIILGESINWARRLINEPSNRKPPRVIAEHARSMATSAGLSVEILDETEIRNLKMGALLGVSQGSDEPPRIVILRNTGNPSSAKLLAYVGKGVTFDSGGISLKQADGMEKMKYDMAGGATAMAAVRALALLQA